MIDLSSTFLSSRIVKNPQIMEKLARLAWKLNPKITRQAMAHGLNNLLLDTTLAPAEGMGTFLTSYPPPV